MNELIIAIGIIAIIAFMVCVLWLEHRINRLQQRVKELERMHFYAND